MNLFLLFSLFFTFVLPPRVDAENWPGWRGPRGDGSSLDTSIPLEWDGSSGKNVAWKTAVPGVGHASPIVYGDRLFLVACLEEEEERILLCYDSRTGKQVWQKTVLTSPLETKNKLNSFASSTPATDGELVYVAFQEVDGNMVESLNTSKPRPITSGRMVVAAYDFEGNQRWLVRPGTFASCHGFCSSPILYKDKLIVNGDHDGDSYIVALNKASGETVWKRPREHKTRSYTPPLIRETNGRTQMVFSGSHCVVSLDPNDGARHWKIDGPTEQYVASMVYDGTYFYMVAGFPTYHAMAIRPDGEGNVTDTHVAWHVTNVRCYVPSPSVIDGYLVVADDRGTGNCFDAATGERFWQERLGDHFSASLVTAKGLVFFLADDGTMTLVRPGRELEVVGTNAIGEECRASPAIADGRLYLRGDKHLFCIRAGGGE
ncbi:MAG: PQQ-binding-like beta-propeller repeat protein [Planctomycetaceae bacterium]|nr:PQQ-binding-like beta-propeller repeat protein [Planctomycetaceae bacterium]